ncbi:MAG: GerMN domain-containing protein, partial [Thermoanaerobaculia bacterium]|nr:GerMN domain-containing protein [Thermoanaerobaculia bacterium]
LRFPGVDSLLYPEAREIPATADPRELATRLLEALIAGPADQALAPVLPPDVAVASVHLTAAGIAYVDLQSDAARPPASGSTQEALTLYGLVQTLVDNVPQIHAVVLLWNSRQPETFGGHIDTTRPLVPDPTLLAPDPDAAPS